MWSIIDVWRWDMARRFAVASLRLLPPYARRSVEAHRGLALAMTADLQDEIDRQKEELAIP